MYHLNTNNKLFDVTFNKEITNIEIKRIKEYSDGSCTVYLEADVKSSIYYLRHFKYGSNLIIKNGDKVIYELNDCYLDYMEITNLVTYNEKAVTYIAAINCDFINNLDE